MAEYGPAHAPCAPYYPLSSSRNPFQQRGLGGFRAGFESKMGCFQIGLRQLCPLSLVQRGIKIDMKIIGGEMAPPTFEGPWPFCPASLPALLRVGPSPSARAAQLRPPRMPSAPRAQSLPFPRLFAHTKALVPVPIPYPSPNIFLTRDGGGHSAAAALVANSLVSSPIPFPKRPLGSMPVLRQTPAWTPRRVPGPMEPPAP